MKHIYSSINGKKLVKFFYFSLYASSSIGGLIIYFLSSESGKIPAERIISIEKGSSNENQDAELTKGLLESSGYTKENSNVLDGPLTVDNAVVDTLTVDSALADPPKAGSALVDPVTVDSAPVYFVTVDNALVDPETVDNALVDPTKVDSAPKDLNTLTPDNAPSTVSKVPGVVEYITNQSTNYEHSSESSQSIAVLTADRASSKSLKTNSISPDYTPQIPTDRETSLNDDLVTNKNSEKDAQGNMSSSKTVTRNGPIETTGLALFKAKGNLTM